MFNETAFYTIDEAAKYLNLPRMQVYRLCRTKGFPGMKIGKHWRISKPKLTEWTQKFPTS